MSEISVRALDPHEFQVEVSEGASRTRHTVQVSAEELERYGAGAAADRLVEESFRFLLEREPKESILERFDLSTIERYFPEYAEAMRQRLG